MAYQSYYTITDWQNLPSQKTALNRTNLLHVENGVKEADDRIVQLDAKKADLSTVNTMVKSVALNADTGILTVTLLNGTVATFDLDIEKVVTNFDITDDNELVLTLADGTQKRIDLTRFVYSVASTATIAMQISNRIMTATIIDGLAAVSSNLDVTTTVLNTLSTGVRFFRYNSNSTGAPDTTPGMGVQMVFDTNFKFQLVTSYSGSNVLWFRQSNGGNFYSWSKLSFA